MTVRRSRAAAGSVPSEPFFVPAVGCPTRSVEDQTILADVTAEGCACARLCIPPFRGGRLDQHSFAWIELSDHGGFKAGRGANVGPAFGSGASRLPRDIGPWSVP